MAGPVSLELDPIFLKGLSYLHSKSKDSAEKLKALLDESLARGSGDSYRTLQKVRSIFMHHVSSDLLTCFVFAANCLYIVCICLYCPQEVEVSKASVSKLSLSKPDSKSLSSSSPGSSSGSSKSSSEKSKKEPEKRPSEKVLEAIELLDFIYFCVTTNLNVWHVSISLGSKGFTHD